MLCRSAYESQACITQMKHKNVISIWSIFQHGGRMLVFSARLFTVYGGFSRFQKTLKVNNFFTIDFQTHVFVWLLISMKFCIRIINTKRKYKSAIGHWWVSFSGRFWRTLKVNNITYYCWFSYPSLYMIINQHEILLQNH